MLLSPCCAWHCPGTGPEGFRRVPQPPECVTCCPRNRKTLRNCCTSNRTRASISSVIYARDGEGGVNFIEINHQKAAKEISKWVEVTWMSWEVDKTEVATTNEGIYGKQRERRAINRCWRNRNRNRLITTSETCNNKNLISKKTVAVSLSIRLANVP